MFTVRKLLVNVTRCQHVRNKVTKHSFCKLLAVNFHKEPNYIQVDGGETWFEKRPTVDD